MQIEWEVPPINDINIIHVTEPIISWRKQSFPSLKWTLFSGCGLTFSAHRANTTIHRYPECVVHHHCVLHIINSILQTYITEEEMKLWVHIHQTLCFLCIGALSNFGMDYSGLSYVTRWSLLRLEFHSTNLSETVINVYCGSSYGQSTRVLGQRNGGDMTPATIIFNGLHTKYFLPISLILRSTGYRCQFLREEGFHQGKL